MIKCILAALAIVTSTAAFAHPGHLDQNGGHWDHQRDVYVCHESYCVPPSCDGNRGSHICRNRYYGRGNYAPGGRYYDNE